MSDKIREHLWVIMRGIHTRQKNEIWECVEKVLQQEKAKTIELIEGELSKYKTLYTKQCEDEDKATREYNHAPDDRKEERVR